MASAQQTLTDGAPTGAVITLNIASPKIEVVSGLQRYDAVQVLHSMDDNPAAGQVAHTFRGDSQKGNPAAEREIELTEAIIGDKVQLILKPHDGGSRSVVMEYRTA